MDALQREEQMRRLLASRLAGQAYREEGRHEGRHGGATTARPVPAPEQVAPPVPAEPRPIVVGVDDSQASRDALVWAAVESLRRDLPLLLVHCLEVAVDMPQTQEQTDAERARADALVQAVHASDPRLAAAQHVLTSGHPGRDLVSRSRDAELLVVGSRHRGPLARAVLGSTAAYCSVHAHCPLVVVPLGWGATGRRDPHALRRSRAADDEEHSEGRSAPVGSDVG